MKTPEKTATLRKAKEMLRNRDRKIARMKDKSEALTVDKELRLMKKYRKR